MTGPIPNFRGHVAVFAIGVAVAGVFFFVLLALGGGAPSLGDDYRVKAVLPTTASLAPGARVTMAGVKVGKVASVTRHGAGALVELDLSDDRVTPIPVDSAAQLRVRTAVGENYVALIPGKARRMLPSDGVLPAANAGDYVDVDKLLSVVQGRARARARQLIQAFGGSVRGRGEDINRLLGGVGASFTHGPRVVEVVSSDRAQVSRLVDRLGSLSAAIGERGAAISQLSRQGVVALRTVADRDERLRSLLRELPPTLARLRTTSATLQSVTRRSAPVVADVAGALGDLRPAVRALRPAATEGRLVVDRLGQAATPLRQTLSRLRAVSAPAAGALPRLRNVLCQANPAIRYLKPYVPDIVQTVVGLASATNAYDALGHTIRLMPVMSDNAVVGLPPDVSKAAFTLLHAGFFGKLLPQTWNPYPRPGEVGGKSSAKPGIHGPQELKASGFVYPRTYADC